MMGVERILRVRRMWCQAPPWVPRLILLPFLALAFWSMAESRDPRLAGAFRRPVNNGWIYVHLEGSPPNIGFQHGSLLAVEIQDVFETVRLQLTHGGRSWGFFREAARDVLWPRVPREYQEELEGLVSGLESENVHLDIWDITAVNAWLELDDYYTKWWDKQHHVPAPAPHSGGDHCSAFVATGSYTKDGRVVIAHNNWTDFMTGARWNAVFDVVPAAGHRFLMDGMPGLIHSGDDFGVNGAGIVITETTISRFRGFDPHGVAEFARARRAMQYSSNIDDFVRIMKDGNNGGYANDWLVADTRANEIASLELGLKNVHLARTRDGYFVGSNFPIDSKLALEETDFDLKDQSNSANARHVRWNQLMSENKGRIDLAAAERFLSDDYDSFAEKKEPNERTLCGRIDLSPRGSLPWQPPYGPAGTAQSKVADGVMAGGLSFVAAMGPPCGPPFEAAQHLRRHREFAWAKEKLRDLPFSPWTTFRAIP